MTTFALAGQHPQSDLPVCQTGDHGHEVGQISPKPIELPHDQRVARTQRP